MSSFRSRNAASRPATLDRESVLYSVDQEFFEVVVIGPQPHLRRFIAKAWRGRNSGRVQQSCRFSPADRAEHLRGAHVQILAQVGVGATPAGVAISNELQNHNRILRVERQEIPYSRIWNIRAILLINGVYVNIFHIP